MRIIKINYQIRLLCREYFTGVEDTLMIYDSNNNERVIVRILFEDKFIYYGKLCFLMLQMLLHLVSVAFGTGLGGNRCIEGRGVCISSNLDFLQPPYQ